MPARISREVRIVARSRCVGCDSVSGLGQTPDSLDVSWQISLSRQSDDMARWLLWVIAAYAGSPAGSRRPHGVGSGRRRPTASVLVRRWRGPEFTAPWPSAWIRRCIRTRDTFDRTAPGSGAGRGMRFAEPCSRAPIAAAKRCPPGASGARMARPFFPTVVSGPAQYGAARVYPGFGDARVRSGRQSGVGILAGYQEKGAAEKMTTRT